MRLFRVHVAPAPDPTLDVTRDAERQHSLRVQLNEALDRATCASRLGAEVDARICAMTAPREAALLSRTMARGRR